MVRRADKSIEHRVFRELPDILPRNSFLVINTTRVFPARIWANRPGKQERIEILLVREESPDTWNALVRPARKAGPGQQLLLGDITARVVGLQPDGSRNLAFRGSSNIREYIEKIGEPPLPPYIRRAPGSDLASDRIRYQTVFARQWGSIAAPTAALHFTPNVLKRLAEMDIPCREILLHVGYGTFQPVRSEDIEEHRMHPEYFEVAGPEATAITDLRACGKRLIAVGTTTTRVLEHLALQDGMGPSGASGFCNLFIYPGFTFRALQGLITNFHLPCSTLFMLVCAFAGREFMLHCYREAVEKEYRFFSYGDCMLIL